MTFPEWTCNMNTLIVQREAYASSQTTDESNFARRQNQTTALMMANVVGKKASTDGSLSLSFVFAASENSLLL